MCEDVVGFDELAVAGEKSDTASDPLSTVPPVRVAANSLCGPLSKIPDEKRNSLRVEFVPFIHTINRWGTVGGAFIG